MDNIAHAIANRLEIEFTYDGRPRIVQPAAHGLHTGTGNESLRGYQVGGTSNTRVPPLWDMFKVAKIAELVVTDRVFANNPPGYRTSDKHLVPIFSQLNEPA